MKQGISAYPDAMQSVSLGKMMVSRTHLIGTLFVILCVFGIFLLFKRPTIAWAWHNMECLRSDLQPASAACMKLEDVNPGFYASLALHSDPVTAEQTLWQELRGPRSHPAAAQLIAFLKEQSRWADVLQVLRVVALPLPVDYVYALATERIPSAGPDEAAQWINLMKGRYAGAPALVIAIVYAAGEYEQVDAVIESIGGSALSPLVRNVWAASLFHRKRYQEAADLWKELSQQTPDNHEYLYWYARALRYAGAAQRALDLLQQLVAEQGEAAPAGYLFELALAYRDNQMCQPALDVVATGIKQTANADLLHSFSQLQTSLDDCIKAGPVKP